MKRYVAVICLMVIAVSVRAQFDPQIGQYMYLPTTYNPAAAGDGDLMKAAGMHRMQFIGIQNAPMSTYFSFSSPFQIGKTKHGAGVRFLNDSYGLFTTQSVYGQYAYRQKIGKGYLAVGVDLGFVNVGFQGTKVNLDSLSESEYFDKSDEAIPMQDKSGMQFDMGIGVWYATPTWWVTISYSHLTQPTIDWDDKSSIKLVGTLYGGGGYTFKLKYHKEWQLAASAFVMSDFRSWDANVTLMCHYKERFRWGLGYRIAGSINILLGVDIISGLSIGYTCELPHNNLLLESAGTHEIMLSYGFNILKPRRTNRYKSVRYL